jgi:L-arabinose isomerase
MPVAKREFTIGLMVTALLEDKYNKTGHMREQARQAAARYARTLEGFGRVVHPGFFEREQEAVKAARAMKAEAVDVVVVVELAYQKGLIPMRALLELEAPLVIWNSQLVNEFPEGADFDLIMLNSGMAGLPELASSLIRAGRRFWLVTGAIDDPAARERLAEHLQAAKAVARLRNARIGIIGHPYEGMTDLMQDDFAVLETFGAACWPIDHDEVTASFAGIEEKKARALIQEQRDLGRSIEVEEPMMMRSARLALALEQVVRQGGYDAVAEFDQVWLSEPSIGIIPFFGTSRLVESHVPFTCEADVLRALSMLVLEELAGHSTFLEHYILDYKRNLMFNSHDGHGNPALADPQHKVRVVPTIYYQGLNGFGASFNYSYRPGEVTLFSIGSVGGGCFQFASAQGQFVEMKPRDISAPQTFFQWSGGGVADFSEAWLYSAPSHHHTAAYGRLNRRLGLVADMLGLRQVIV